MQPRSWLGLPQEPDLVHVTNSGLHRQGTWCMTSARQQQDRGASGRCRAVWQVCDVPQHACKMFLPVAILKVRQGSLQSRQVSDQHIKAVVAVLNISLPSGGAFDARHVYICGYNELIKESNALHGNCSCSEAVWSHNPTTKGLRRAEVLSSTLLKSAGADNVVCNVEQRAGLTVSTLSCLFNCLDSG